MAKVEATSPWGPYTPRAPLDFLYYEHYNIRMETAFAVIYPAIVIISIF